MSGDSPNTDPAIDADTVGGKGPNELTTTFARESHVYSFTSSSSASTTVSFSNTYDGKKVSVDLATLVNGGGNPLPVTGMDADLEKSNSAAEVAWSTDVDGNVTGVSFYHENTDGSNGMKVVLSVWGVKA